MPRIAVLDAPTNLGLKPPAPGREPGVRRMPDVLRTHGLIERLGAEDAGRVPAPPYSPERDPDTRVRNAPAIARYSVELADAVGRLLDGGRFPLVLGGDCSLLLGTTLALRERGRFGLLFLDGHRDLATPDTSGSGGAAGMDLALVTGHGPDPLTDLRSLRPLVRETDVVLLGHRDEDEGYPPDLLGISRTVMRSCDLAEARRTGMRKAVLDSFDRLRSNGVEGVWIHLDVDVLDVDLMPAVDSPEPGGLAYEELDEILSAAFSTGLAIGMEVTIFDPDLDPDGRIAAGFVEALAGVFRRARERGTQ